MDLKKDHRDAYVYKQLFVEIRDRYRDYIPVHVYVTVNLYNQVICILPDVFS